MTVEHEEKEFIRKLPKPYPGCPLLQAEKDRKLTAALLAEFGTAYPHVDCADMADRAMRVIKGMR